MPTSLQLDLKIDSPRHDKIKDAILERYNLSQKKMSLRYKAWQDAEDLYLAYTPPTSEKSSRQATRDTGENVFVPITIPYSYAILLTAHTYWSSVFLSRSPIMQYTGRHGESQQQVQAVEALLDYQTLVGGMIPPWYLWLLDAGKYGMGVVGFYWDEELIKTSKVEERTKMAYGVIPIPGKTERVVVPTMVPGYTGNRLFNVRPQDFFPDPNVSLRDFQQGEFCIRKAYAGWTELYTGAASGKYIKENVKYLKENHRSLGIRDRETGSSQVELPDTNEFGTQDSLKGNLGSIELLEAVWNIVPKDWDLGDGEYPEKWVITLANRNVVIGVQPQNCNHGKFPYGILTYDIDGYTHNPRGLMELTKPLSATLEWLYNTHMFNIAKVLNDMLVVDPSKIVWKDLVSGGAGRIIRLARGAWGTDARLAISQLPVSDVTQTHLRDAQLVEQLIQRVTGVTDNIMGMVYPGGRKTATEVRTSSSFGVNRLRTFSEYNSALGWSPLAQMLLQNTQQHYDIEKKFKIAGDLLAADPRTVLVTPEDIAGFYDFVPVDGTMPIDRMAQANLWKEILIGIQNMPLIGQQYDIPGMFAWMAQLAGLKNITRFKLAPDAQVQQQMQAGNLVPAKGSNGAKANGSGAGVSSAVGPATGS